MALNPIDGCTHLVGLVGWPVEHSVSPVMQNAAFAALGLNWRYVPLPVPPGQVEVALRGLGALGFAGANVTVPHKEEVARLLLRLFGAGALSSDAQALGAVNTLVVGRREPAGGEATLRGHNTDAAGFVGALREGGFDPSETTAVVVGAGGAARAVVFGLMEAEAETIVVLNRTPERGEALVSDLDSAVGGGPAPTLRALPLTERTLVETAREAKLLVNATSVGMWPRVERSIWPDDVTMPSQLTVFDLVYNPRRTKLQDQTLAGGAEAIDGLGMLIGQGALALEMWTGGEAPLEAMRQACEQAL